MIPAQADVRRRQLSGEDRVSNSTRITLRCALKSPRVLGVVVGMALWLPLAGAYAAPPEAPFPVTVDFKQGWEVRQDLAPLEIDREKLVLGITGADPGVVTPLLSLPDGRDLWVRLRVKSDVGGLAQLYAYRDTPTEAASQLFELSAQKWEEVLIPLPLGRSPTRLRFRPPGTGGRCLLDSMRIEEPAKAGVIRVKATASELVVTAAPSDGRINIVEMQPHESLDAVAAAPVLAELPGGAARSITVPRFVAGRDRLYDGFAARNARSGRCVGAIHFVEDFDAVSRCTDPIPPPATIKGLQVQMVDDAIALGVKQATLNVNLAQIVDADEKPDSYRWDVDGKPCFFRRAMVDAIPVKPLSDAGIQVTLILLNYQSADPRIDLRLRHPLAQINSPNHVVAFNTASPEGIAQLRACAEFLADHFSGQQTPHGRVVAYIVGNEINSYYYWYNLGPAPMEFVAAEYSRALRIVHAAIRKTSAHARVYISLDHQWAKSFDGNRFQTSGGKQLLDQLTRLSRLGGDIDWHLAHHPYPENMFDPRSWLDRSAAASPDAPWITYKNLEQLPAYLRRPEMLYHGSPRRITLSEQGFHSPDTSNGELWQAAGFCYAYARTRQLDGIDAFILHRHVDYQHEGGLYLGLWTRRFGTVFEPATKKQLYEVFRLADTPEWDKAFKFALPVIGIDSWDELKAAKP